MLDDLRAEFARYLADNASARFSMDKALVHVVGLAYRIGMQDGIEQQMVLKPYAHVCRGRLEFDGEPCPECRPVYVMEQS